MKKICLNKDCSFAGAEQDISAFNKATESKDGLRGKCRACQKKDRHLYYENNKEREINRAINWGINNKEKTKISNKNYQINNKDKVIMRRKRYYRDNKELISSKSQEYYVLNSLLIKNKAKLYSNSNKDKIKEYRKKNYDKISLKHNYWKENNKVSIAAYNKQYKKGLYIDNMIHTINYSNAILLERINMFIHFMEAFNKHHTTYLERLLTKSKHMIDIINEDITIKSQSSSPLTPSEPLKSFNVPSAFKPFSPMSFNTPVPATPVSATHVPATPFIFSPANTPDLDQPANIEFIIKEEKNTKSVIYI